jgi:hypothetical protein
VAHGEDGRWRYYAGGFPTDSLAAVAVEKLRRAGFRAPAAVVWMDGTLIDPAAADETKIYRIDITGPEELPGPARDAIAAATAGGETPPDIVRSPAGFIITPLGARTAIALRQTLERMKPTYPDMEARLSKNPE